MHLLASTSTLKKLPSRDKHWPISMVLRDLSSQTHAYLMDLYWSCHNSVLHMVHRIAFSEDEQSGSNQFYSTFLHVAILATGFRYADKSKPDIQKLALSGPTSSILHQKAKELAKEELEKSGGIPSIQALFLVAYLECAAGRDENGWMYSGQLFRNMNLHGNN